MSDDQFSELKQLIVAQGAQNDKEHLRLFKLVQQIDAKLATKADTEDVHRIITLLDGIAGRISTDDAERGAISHQLDRHEKWLHQLADHNGATLHYE